MTYEAQLRDRVADLAAATAKLADRGGADDASDAYHWTEIGTLAVEGLQATGVSTIDTAEPEDEAIEPLPYGWTSTPGEVEAFCERYGLDYRYLSGKVVVTFDSDPGKEVRTAVKLSGFAGKKVGRGKTNAYTWTHGCMGSWLNSKSGKAAAYRSAIERGEGPEAARAAVEALRKPYTEDRSAEEVAAAAGGW